MTTAVMTKGQAWLLAARPATLGAAVAPVAVGSACAYAAGGFHAGAATLALVGALLIQVGTNLANDVFDFEKGADTDGRLGPTRAVQAGLLSAGEVRAGMVLAFALAALCGVGLTLLAGWPVAAIGLASIAAGIAYTGGPWPLGYHGLGDLFVLAFFGVAAVCGTAYVQAGSVPALAWWAALPVGGLATAILVVNNLRDRATDALAGKRTLAVRLGERGAVVEYALLVGVAYLVPIGAALAGGTAGAAWRLLPLVTLPIAAWLVRRVARERGRALNPLLGATARLALGHGLLLAAGIALGGSS